MAATPRRKTNFFALDDRCIGGTHMIQQQFQDMHRKIDHARKHVDNEPPVASMFKRPHFSTFGVDYRERVRAKPFRHVKALVDSHEPDSYHLIANLYINRRVRSHYASPVQKAVPTPTAPEPNGRVTYASRPRPLSARVPEVNKAAAGRSTRAVLTDAVVDQSVASYAASIADRLDEIQAHREALQKRRLLRRDEHFAAQATASMQRNAPGGPREGRDGYVREAALAALGSMRAADDERADDERAADDDSGSVEGIQDTRPEYDAEQETSADQALRNFVWGAHPPAGIRRDDGVRHTQHPHPPPRRQAELPASAMAFEGVLREPGCMPPVAAATDAPGPTAGTRLRPGGAYPVPVPPPRLGKADAATTPPHVRGQGGAPLSGEMPERPAAVACDDVVSQAAGAPLEAGPGSSRTAPKYGALKFPSTFTSSSSDNSPSAAAGVNRSEFRPRRSQSPSASEQLVSANDFVQPYDESDDDVF